MNDSEIDVDRRKTPLPEVQDPDRLAGERSAFFHSVGFPRSFFRGRRVLQVGGPAESALQYAIWGAKVTILPTGDALTEYAERLFLRHRQTLVVVPEDTLLQDPARMAQFEFVACEETLRSSDDPRRDLEVILTNLAHDAVMLAAVPESHGTHRRQLMQRIVRILASTGAERLHHGRESFGAHVEATARARSQPYEAVLANLFVNDRADEFELADVCRIFGDAGFTYLGSDPGLDSPSRDASPDASDPFDYMRNRAHYRFLERLWAAFGGDPPRKVRDLDPVRLASETEHEMATLAAIEERIAQRDVDDAMIRHLAMGGHRFDTFRVLAIKA